MIENNEGPEQVENVDDGVEIEAVLDVPKYFPVYFQQAPPEGEDEPHYAYAGVARIEGSQLILDIEKGVSFDSEFQALFLDPMLLDPNTTQEDTNNDQ